MGVVLVAPLALGCLGPAQESLLGVCPAGLIEGTLGLDAKGGVGITSTGESTSIVWPPGYFIQSGGGTVDIRNSTGNTVARTGDQVSLRGGLDETGRWVVCGEPVQRR